MPCSLAAFTAPHSGVLDYVSFFRATQMCTNDDTAVAVAFERAVFNVAFHNRDDHPKNCLPHVASGSLGWRPLTDVTFYEGAWWISSDGRGAGKFPARTDAPGLPTR